jgi:hypothetical protein
MPRLNKSPGTFICLQPDQKTTHSSCHSRKSRSPIATLIEVIRVRFQSRHLDRCADVQPQSNRELVLELFAGIARIAPVHLDSFQEQVLFACFDSDCLNLGILPVVIINFSVHSLSRNNSCLFDKGFSCDFSEIQLSSRTLTNQELGSVLKPEENLAVL